MELFRVVCYNIPREFKMTPREDRMNDIILVKLGEIILKGLNRRDTQLLQRDRENGRGADISSRSLWRICAAGFRI